mgnify:CR=1 FL=1
MLLLNTRSSIIIRKSKKIIGKYEKIERGYFIGGIIDKNLY